MAGKIRWNSFDCIKGLACIAIVLIHYNFPGDVGFATKAFCRFGVPVFFITSGFFFMYNGAMDDAKTVKKIRHICMILFSSATFYAIFAVFENIIRNPNWNMRQFIAQKATADRIVKLFVTNDPLVYSHLWFMLALIYCYVFALLFFNSKKCVSLSLLAAPLLLVVHNVLQEFGGFDRLKTSFAIPGSEGRIYLYNLFILRALPFFLIGIIIRKYMDYIKKIPANRYVLFLIFIAGGLLAIKEHFTFREDQFYIGNYMMVATLILFAIKNPTYENKVLKYLGRELSMYIYILHIAVGRVLDIVASENGIKEGLFYQYGRAAAVLVTTIFISAIVNWGIKTIKNKLVAK